MADPNSEREIGKISANSDGTEVVVDNHYNAAKAYADQLKEIAGTDVTVATMDTHMGDGTIKPMNYLVIDLSDGKRDLTKTETTDRAIDALAALRAKAGLEKGELGFNTSHEDSGQICIPVDRIAKYDASHGGPGALFEKLKAVAPEFKETITTAKVNVLPSAATYIGDGNFDFSKGPDNKPIDNSQYATNPLVIKDANFALPDNIKKGGMEYAVGTETTKGDESLTTILKSNKVDPASTKELRDAATLDGSGKLTPEELASYMLAKSMSVSADGTVAFKDSLTKKDLQGDGKDPKVVFAMAQEILTKTYGVPIVENGKTVDIQTLDQRLKDAISGMKGLNTGGAVNQATVPTSAPAVPVVTNGQAQGQGRQ